ncbi:efflux RND transporter permease subunit [Nitrincola sp. MINF-07-Sa-05]|uniref:efflux RND transporter permease subunit n=1 Tax=Nitrincola salilacus TaxID=3400273 RepID=UPI0039180FD0
MGRLSQAIVAPLKRSEQVIERVLFHHRLLVISLFVLVTLLLVWQASQIRPDASFIKMIPSSHPYVENYLDYRDDLSGLGNSVRVSVATTGEDIFSTDFQDVLRRVTDELFFIPGVDRSAMQSIWTPNVRWTEVTEEGFVGGPVIPPDYDGTQASLESLRLNVLRSGQVGRLVANDFRSAIIEVPLFDHNPETGERLDYNQLSQQLEELVRDQYQNDNVSIHITGFAKIVGDLIDGARQVALFFAIALVITTLLLYLYSRSIAGTLIPIACSLIAVIWQLGLLNALGYGIDPYSMLVPFLVFAIAVSHGVQIVNTIRLESLQDPDPWLSARRAFRVLYIPGLTALVSDGIGFFTLMVIDIQVIQELAVAASMGVAVIILTNLILLPVLMSYAGVGQKAITHARKQSQQEGLIWQRLSWFATPAGAGVSISVAVLALLYGLYAAQGLQIGDLDSGAPELRADSRYNLDNAFITDNYSTSSDVFVVMAVTPPEQCTTYETLAGVERFQHFAQGIEGVQSSVSLADVSKRVTAGLNEGNPKWRAVSRNQFVINASLAYVPGGLMNTNCSLLPVIIFLDDHKAATLDRLSSSIEQFAADYDSDALRFKLAAGNSGFEAATNQVIARAQYEMLAWVYGVVSLLCLITFRSIRTVACIITPLALTSVLCQALMAHLGIGVKVATLPVIALGVGIGVDYGIYIYSRLSSYLAEGLALREAYLETLKTTGKPVAFTGLTLAIGVILWVFSPIKFQADMGILLTFMFLWNMLGALLLLPALACVLKPHPGQRDPGLHKSVNRGES